ncbi:MAG: BMP family ABC transporter substrate-binding protein [Bacilli bacterium]|nr:BMP family ABC transporter substrate-binding protein [Bacilli bacterium]
MKKHWKLALLPALFLVCATHVGCARSTAEVALVTGLGDIDDGSFNQSSWEAVKEFCEDPEHPLSYEYYRPFATSDFARRLAIRQAVAKGAKVIVFPGFDLANVAAQAQIDYPNVKFLLLDSTVSNYNAPNLCCVTYSSAYSGYLAGYATGYDYAEYKKEHGGLGDDDKYTYGYCGAIPIDTVFPFGYGFIQGLVRGIDQVYNPDPTNTRPDPKLDVKFLYSHVFAHDDKTSAAMMGWYAEGLKAVFSCGGKLYQSVTDGVKDYNHKHGYYDFIEGEAPIEAARWIGVDTDQYSALKDDHERKTIITSALKDLHQTVKDALTYYVVDKKDNGAWNDIIGNGPGSRDQKTFESEKEARDYINNKDTAHWFAGYKYDITQNDENKWIINLKTSDPKITYTFSETNPTWKLELKDLFGVKEQMGEHGLNPEERIHDYVGIPTALKSGSDSVLRGFNYFTRGLLEDAVNKIHRKEWKVYCGDGTDIYINQEGTKDPHASEPGYYGYARFMSERSNKFYVDTSTGDSDAYTPFNEEYFPEDYNPENIIVTPC